MREARRPPARTIPVGPGGTSARGPPCAEGRVPSARRPGPIGPRKERESLGGGDSPSDHRWGPVMSDVSGREARVRSNRPGEEAVSERLPRDDSDFRLPRGFEGLVDPLLAEQAEGDLQDLG